MRRYFIATTAILGFAVGAFGTAHADDTDVNFLKSAASANLATVKIGEMAQQRGDNAAIQDLGQTLAADGRKGVAHINTVLDHMGQPEVNAPTDGDRSEVDKLAGLPDDGFYSEFQRYIVNHYPQLIASYQKEANQAGYEQARDVAKEGLPVLQKQLALAKTLRKPQPAVAHQAKWARQTPPMGGDTGPGGDH
jgi:predicted outer membrane protein